MTSESSSAQPPRDLTGEPGAAQPSTGHPLKPADVPVFSCLVYVSREAGNVRARVANLPGIDGTAASEREALGKVVRVFKERVGQWLRSGMEIPWIAPPSPPEPGEQSRFIPVHL